MQKLTLTAVILGTVILTGCQSIGMGESNSIANVDFNSMTCSEIKQVFVDSQDKMDKLDSGAGLLSKVGMGSGTDAAKATMQSAYFTAKEAATPVMEVKGCSETI